jgi:hypothetical protein
MQGSIQVFAIQFSELRMGELGITAQITTLAPRGVRFELAAIFASVGK